MLIDLDSYRVQKKEIIRAYDIATVKDVLEIICVTSPAIHTANVVLGFYLAEEIGFTPELVVMIKRLIKFYGYSTIKGAPENMPDFGLRRIG
jgi:hypothetical protein